MHQIAAVRSLLSSGFGVGRSDLIGLDLSLKAAGDRPTPTSQQQLEISFLIAGLVEVFDFDRAFLGVAEHLSGPSKLGGENTQPGEYRNKPGPRQYHERKASEDHG